MLLTDGSKILNRNVQSNPKKKAVTFFDGFFILLIMKEIQLTQGKVALVDDEDFERVNQFKWYANKIGHTWYAIRVYRINNKKITEMIHWLVMGSKWIDHIDREGLNCQKNNLRKCTQRQNNMNRASNKISSSKYKGVHWYSKANTWQYQLKLNGKIIYSGYHKNEIEAAKLYDIAAKKYFGEFAYLNFP